MWEGVIRAISYVRKTRACALLEKNTILGKAVVYVWAEKRTEDFV